MKNTITSTIVTYLLLATAWVQAQSQITCEGKWRLQCTTPDVCGGRVILGDGYIQDRCYVHFDQVEGQRNTRSGVCYVTEFPEGETATWYDKNAEGCPGGVVLNRQGARFNVTQE